MLMQNSFQEVCMKKMRYIFISDWSSLKCLMSRKRALRKSGEKGDLSKHPVSIWKYFLFNIWKIWKYLEDFFVKIFFFQYNFLQRWWYHSHGFKPGSFTGLILQNFQHDSTLKHIACGKLHLGLCILNTLARTATCIRIKMRLVLS